MRKNIKYLSNTEFDILKKVINDPFFFSEFIFVINAMLGKTKFTLYPYQKQVLWCFLTKRFNIVLKFRQAGLTELIAMYALWLAMYHPEKNILIISIKERVAKRLLRKIKFMYKNLPEYLKTPVINGRGEDLGTASELEFSNGSIITSIPTTEDAGRSEALSLLIIDEAAIVKWANTIWASAFPTLSTGGSAILNSCVTGDTQIIGKTGNFRIDTICPPRFGKLDISHLGLQVLSHTGNWRRVVGSVNKGDLETWEIKNRFGDILKCTPEHKLLTSRGWRSVRQIMDKNLNTIIYNSGLDSVKLSKLTLIRKYQDTIYDLCVEEDESYITVSNFINHNTPYGVGNFFHKQWTEATHGINGFNPIRLYWQMHPERDQLWYDEQRAILGPRRTAQEIDGDFLTSGNNVFDLMDIKAIEEELSDYELYDTTSDARFNKIRTFNGALKVFLPPKMGEIYSLGADISTGRSKDFTSFTLFDRYGEEMAVFKSQIPITAAAKLLGEIGRVYNYAYLAPEANDIGLAVAMKLSEEGYRNLYYSKKLLKEKGMSKPKEEKIPGWYTTKRNRPVIITGLEEDIRLGNIICKDPYFVQEAYTFIYDNENRPVAMGKKSSSGADELDEAEYVDDAILGKAIANHIRKGKIKSHIILPK